MAGRLQGADHKSVSELIGAGGTEADLLNDQKIYLTATGLNKTLSQAIIDGDLSGGGGAAVAARAATGLGQGIPNATFTIINFDSVAFDTNSAITTGGSWHFTAPSTGYYWVESNLFYDTSSGVSAGTTIIYAVYVNGSFYSSIFRRYYPSSVGTYPLDISGGTLVGLTASDTLDLRLYNDGVSNSLLADGSYNHISISKV